MARVQMHQMHKGLGPQESNRRLTLIIPYISRYDRFWASNCTILQSQCAASCSQLLCTVGIIALPRIPQFTLLPFMVVQLCHALNGVCLHCLQLEKTGKEQELSVPEPICAL